MIPNTKALVRMAAAIMGDCEAVICRFLAQPGSQYVHFSSIAENLRIPLIMNLTVGQGKFKEDHYQVVSRLILDSARKFWLPSDGAKKSGDTELDKKRHLAGFFLTSLLYFKQPYAGLTKIFLDSKEMTTLKEFLEVFKTNEEVQFIYNHLTASKAFMIAANSIERGPENWRRTLLTMQNNEVVEQSLNERSVQDALAYGTSFTEVLNALTMYRGLKDEFGQCLMQSTIPSHLFNSEDPSPGPNIYNWLSGDARSPAHLKGAIGRLARIARRPILTLEQLTLDQIIERRIMSEYRQRLSRCRKRILEGPQIPKREYVQAGGIWGRKKAMEEGQEHRQRRERGGFSRNLWVYLNDLPFDYDPIPIPNQQ